MMPLTSSNDLFKMCISRKARKRNIKCWGLGPAVSTTGGMEVSQLLRYFIEGKPDSSTSVFNGNEFMEIITFVQIPVSKKPKCPCCVGKEFTFLNKNDF
jgi:hypothetical protein